MSFDNAHIISKLKKWKQYLNDFNLPDWDTIPDIGLYMEQVIELIRQYLDYLPPELKDDQFITPSTINNYVRTKVMPEPHKKQYYRIHIVYLIIIITLKQSLSLAIIQKIIPVDLDEESLKELYSYYVRLHHTSTMYLCDKVETDTEIFAHGSEDDNKKITEDIRNVILSSAIIGGFTRILAEKLIKLEESDTED